MIEYIKKHQRSLLVGLIIICILAIPIGGVRYLKKLQNNLKNEKMQDVMEMTLQKTQAFDNFISEDQARLHSYADDVLREALEAREAGSIIFTGDYGSLLIYGHNKPLHIMDMTVAVYIMTIYENPAYTSTTTVVHNFTSLTRIFIGILPI